MPEFNNQGDVQSRPTLNRSLFRSNLPVSITSQVLELVREQRATTDGMIHVARDPQEANVYLVISVPPSTLVASSWIVYLTGSDVEPTGWDEAALYNGLVHAGNPALAKHLKDIGVTANMNESEDLDEGYGRGWAILPATMELYGKRVVDIITAASTWDDCWIFVCKKTENDGRERFAFLSASGNMHYSVGHTNETYHDQTGASKGRYTIVNKVHVVNGVIESSENRVGLKEKASLAVFK